MNRKTMECFFVAVTFATLSGCQVFSHTPRADWLADFQITDSILLENQGKQRIVSDPDSITRLRNIYENANWKPYRITLPSNLGERTIDLLQGESKLRRFSYTGSLWESESYTENRTTELSDDDTEWLESLFELEK